MKKIIFTGSGVALVTPMNQDFSINYEQMDALIEWHIAEGTDAIVTCGTTGEASVLTDEEHLEIIRRTIETVAGRVPVIAGVGSNHTAYAAWLTREAAAMGADAMLHVTPYYNKTSQRGLVQHFITLADVSEVPVIVYNVPSRTGMSISLSAYKELAKHPHIVATKEASGDFSTIAALRSVVGDDLAVYSGNDDQIVPIMSLGGVGVITVLGNVAPRFTHDLCAAYLTGDTQKATQMQLEAIALCGALFCDVNPIPVKEALNLMGREVGRCRLPLVDTTPENRAHIQQELQRFGLL